MITSSTPTPTNTIMSNALTHFGSLSRSLKLHCLMSVLPSSLLSYLRWSSLEVSSTGGSGVSHTAEAVKALKSSSSLPFTVTLSTALTLASQLPPGAADGTTQEVLAPLYTCREGTKTQCSNVPHY